MRVGQIGEERPAVAVGDDKYVDVSDLVSDFHSIFFESGGVEKIRSTVERRISTGNVRDLGNQRIGAPITRPHQILCIGLNYRDHAEETDAQVPPEPILFTKAPNTLIGPNDSVRIPRNSRKTDWEVELGVVIRKRASYLDSPEDALDYIAGYTIVNDVSEREFQIERQGQWSKGKSCETFNPAGPWLVTPDEVGDPLKLKMRLTLNGERKQDSSTSQMVYGPGYLVYYLSQFLVLEAGDLINTGTPAGVGMGHKPPQYLEPGDVMELEIEKLGKQRQEVLAPR